MPIRDYEQVRPWIDRIARGEPGVLTAAGVRRLVPSSGSTAARKLIPYTRALLTEFGRGISPWIVDLHRQDDALRSGSAYWSISPPPLSGCPQTPRSAVPIGFDTDSAYLGGLLRRLVDRTMAVPAGVGRIFDKERFLHATLLHLLRARDLCLISVWHPSFLTLLLDALRDGWGQLIEEAGRSDLRRLEPTDWRSIWPRLRLISCWGDAGAAQALADLRRRFPDIRVQPKGLIATEAFVSLPFAGGWPVAVRSHFFEFLDDAGNPRLVNELDQGGEYSVVVTTGGGLFRYRLNDRIRVDGFIESTPSIRLVGREDQVSDLRGEKLNERHVGRTLRELGEALGLRLVFAMLAPDQQDEGIGYTLYIQSEPPPPADLADHLERALRANPHYAHCLALGQLLPLRVFAVRGSAHQRYLERCERLGQRLGEIKPGLLSRETGWSEWLEGAYREPRGPRRWPAGK